MSISKTWTIFTTSRYKTETVSCFLILASFLTVCWFIFIVSFLLLKQALDCSWLVLNNDTPYTGNWRNQTLSSSLPCLHSPSIDSAYVPPDALLSPSVFSDTCISGYSEMARSENLRSHPPNVNWECSEQTFLRRQLWEMPITGCKKLFSSHMINKILILWNPAKFACSLSSPEWSVLILKNMVI